MRFWTTRVMARLVRVLPRELRAAYGASIVESFEAAYGERKAVRGRVAAHVYAWRAAADLLATAIRERRVDREGPRGLGVAVRMDLRGAVRSLRATPVFTLSALLMVGLGVGVNAAIFTATKALLLSAPPYPEADRLVLVDLTGRRAGETEARAYFWSYPRYVLLRDLGELAVAPVSGFARRTASFVFGERASRVNLELVSPSYLGTLGARAERGRLLVERDEDAALPSMVAVLSEPFWSRELGRDPAIVGRTMEVASVRVEVVGVAAAGFEGLTGDVDLWLPLSAARRLYTRFMTDEPNSHWFQVVGRLAPGRSREEANAELNARVRRIEEVYPSSTPNTEIGGAVRWLRDARMNPVAEAAVLVLTAAACMVLLIACANLAGLLLARGLERRNEIAVQLALGASRGRVVRALLAESVMLAAGGGVVALAVTAAGVRLMRVAWPVQYAMSGTLRSLDPAMLRVDPVVVLFAAGLTLVTGLLFGVLPAVRLSRAEPAGALRAGGRASVGDRPSRFGGRSALIAIETGLALVLLVGAGLMTASLARLLRVERGYHAENLMTFQYEIPRTSAFARQPMDLHSALLERLQQDPRILGAALGCAVPMTGHCFSTRITRVDEAAEFSEENRPSVFVETVGDDYFATLGTAVRAGRVFDPRDNDGAPLALVINRAAARAYFGATDPIGRMLSLLYSVRPGDARYTVVGVVDDILHDRPEQGVAPQVYISLRQGAVGLDATVFVRTAGEPLSLVPEIAALLRSMEPGAALFGVSTANQEAVLATANTRAVLWLLVVFAAVAVVLSAAGIWSLVAGSVGQRTRELGLRMALGAPAAEVAWLVVGRGAFAALAGVLVGLPAALLASRGIASLLFGVRATDARVYAAAAITLGAIALVASWLPALRASRIDPMRAMHAE